jgi:serine/threonine protein kinase
MKGDLLKITDFGWCLLNCLEEDKKTYCGTPAYISPEV